MTPLRSNRRSAAGFSLVIVLVMTGAAFLILTGVLLWSSHSGKFSQRTSEYRGTLAAAEAATEKVLARMSRDFQATNGGFDLVEANLASYTALAPNSSESSAWDGHEFASPGGVPVSVTLVSNRTWGVLNSKAFGFSASNAVYRIVANARDTASDNNIVGAVRQDIQLAEIPLFSFFAFYHPNMEFGPLNGTWNLIGPVHCNSDAYFHPEGRDIVFSNSVTASGGLHVGETHPLNSNNDYAPPYGDTEFEGGAVSHANALLLPVGMAPTNIWAYYKGVAGLTIEVTGDNAGVVVGPAGYSRDWSEVTNFINTTCHFVDKRQNLYSPQETAVTEFDVAKFKLSMSALGNPKVVYIADLRPDDEDWMHAVRVVNGGELPFGGLALATPNPLYVKGSYNLPGGGGAPPQPASFAADAVTILSADWDDSLAASPLSVRMATPTGNTINAAFLAGIVPNGSGSDYSGGIEGFFRLLETWGSSVNLTINGSIVVPFYKSQIANGPWYRTGAFDIYTFPNRIFRFDPAFANPAKLPPGTPYLRTVIRSEWKAIQPGAAE